MTYDRQYSLLGIPSFPRFSREYRGLIVVLLPGSKTALWLFSYGVTLVETGNLRRTRHGLWRDVIGVSDDQLADYPTTAERAVVPACLNPLHARRASTTSGSVLGYSRASTTR